MEQNMSENVPFEIYQELGECYTQIGNIDEAIVHFETACRFEPQSERPFIGLGVAVMQKNNLDEAKYYFNKAIDKNPNNDKALTGLAMAITNSGDVPEGLKTYQKSMDINPTSLTTLMGLMKSAYALGELEVAVTYLNKYLDLYPGNMKILYCLAGTYFKQKRYHECRECLEKIFIFEPEHPDANDLMRALEEVHQECTYAECQNS